MQTLKSYCRKLWLQQWEVHLLSSPCWLVLIGWAKLASWMEVASNNPSVPFPNPLWGQENDFINIFYEHATASWNSSCGGQRILKKRKKRWVFLASVFYLLMRLGGGDLPSNCDKHSQRGAEYCPTPVSLWRLQKNNLTAPAVCIDMNLFQTKRGIHCCSLEEFPPRCTDDTVCCAAAAAAGWLSNGAAWV